MFYILAPLAGFGRIGAFLRNLRGRTKDYITVERKRRLKMVTRIYINAVY